MEITPDQFARDAADNSLVSPEDIAAARENLPPEKRDTSTTALAKALVRAGKLTNFQAAAIYQGKAKGLAYGKYVVLDKLGAGGMGVVYKARHRTMERVVALKVLSPKAVDSSPDAVQRFHQEVRAAAQLNHTNIVTAHDADQQGRVHYLVMEYVEGEDLDARLKRDGPLPVDQAVDCIVQAARGLEFAHQKGIIHRDIKPANLLLDKEGTVKILDMGLARMEKTVGARPGEAGQPTRGLTQSGQIMGTCDYMAPEQAMDTKHATARSDIYSLGCTLYRLLTGNPPYGGDTLMKILMGHQKEPIPSLREKRPDVPPALETVYQRMMAKDPAQRPQTATEVIADLQACLGTSAAAPPPIPSGSPATPAPAETDGDLTAFLQSVVQSTTATKAPVKAKQTGETVDIAPGQDTDQHIHGRPAPLPGVPVTPPPAIEAATTAPPRTASRTSAGPSRSKKASLTADQKKLLLFGGIGLVAVVGVVGIVVLAMVLTVETPWGTIVVEAEDDRVEVAVLQGGKEIQVVDADKNWTLRVDQGDYRLELRGGTDNFQLDRQTVTVRDGDRVIARVTRRDKEVALENDPATQQPGATDRVPARTPAVSEQPAEPLSSVTSPEIVAALKRPVSLDLMETPLNELVARLKKLYAIDIRIDNAGLAADGFKPDMPQTVNIKRVTLASGLLVLLRQAGLVCVARPDFLLITTPDGIRQHGGSVPGLTVPSPKTQTHPAAQKMMKVLMAPTTIECSETSLWEVAFDLQQLHGIPIFFDERVLDDAGISTDTPITQNIQGISLRPALLFLLDQVGLTCVRQDEFLMVTTPAEADFWGGALQPTAKTDGAAESPARQIIDAALASPTTLQISETPLKDVMEKLEQLYQIPILIDQRALKSVGVDINEPVSQQQDKIPLRSALRLMLEPLKLECVQHDEFLLITTPAAARWWDGTRSSQAKAMLNGREAPVKPEIVEAGLKWLAAHPLDDGGWSADHSRAPDCRGRCRNSGTAELRTAATALALLPFLMAGDTHVQGDHQDVVKRGLRFLIRRASDTPHGADFSEPVPGTMYSHGLATLALCDAYGLTHDQGLKQPAQRALDFIAYAQDPTGGGWRYQPQEKGDTSVTGWQMLALKSGHLGYLKIPPDTIKGATRFLDSVQADGWKFGYTDPPVDMPRPATTAIGLFCRMSTGWKRDNPDLQKGIAWLADQGPDPDNVYFNFFAAHALRAYGGRVWDPWQAALHSLYRETQANDGHETGSWYIEGDGHGSEKAGRLYCTSLALMTLQVSNRYRCLYGDVTD